MVIAGVIGFVVLVIVCVCLYIFRCQVFGTDCQSPSPSPSPSTSPYPTSGCFDLPAGRYNGPGGRYIRIITSSVPVSGPRISVHNMETLASPTMPSSSGTYDYCWQGGSSIVQTIFVQDRDGNFSKWLPTKLYYKVAMGGPPIISTSESTSSSEEVFRYVPPTECTDETKSVGKCPNKQQSWMSALAPFRPVTTSDIIMGVDPSTMQWTFTQGQNVNISGRILNLDVGTYTFDYSSVAPYHVFGFTSDPCGVADVTDGITYSGNKMTVTVTPEMKTKQYWYACQIHNCMTSLSPIIFQ